MYEKFIILCLCSFFFFTACGKEIGDECEYDADCSLNMDRNCDLSQPGGYCLMIGCGPGECPEEAVCVEFTSPCPEEMDEETCAIIEPNRGRTYCLKRCKSNGDCRSAYECILPEELSAAIIDFNPKGNEICVPELEDE